MNKCRKRRGLDPAGKKRTFAYKCLQMRTYEYFSVGICHNAGNVAGRLKGLAAATERQLQQFPIQCMLPGDRINVSVSRRQDGFAGEAYEHRHKKRMGACRARPGDYGRDGGVCVRLLGVGEVNRVETNWI